jgi:hypothetical protein
VEATLWAICSGESVGVPVGWHALTNKIATKAAMNSAIPFLENIFVIFTSPQMVLFTVYVTITRL